MLADLLECMKRAAMEAVRDAKPMTVIFGRVTAVNPVEIQISQKLTLKQSLGQLIFTRNVIDYQTQIAGETVTVYNSLKLGESVILLRQEGGQKFIVLDRAVG